MRAASATFSSSSFDAGVEIFRLDRCSAHSSARESTYPSWERVTVPASRSCTILVPRTDGTSDTSPSSTQSKRACSAPSTSACTASEDSRWMALSHASPRRAQSSPSRRTYMHGSKEQRVKPMPPSARGAVRYWWISAFHAWPLSCKP